MQAVQDKNAQMVQYHALALLHSIKSNDRLAVSKLVSQLTKQQLKSPLAMCLLIRYAVNVIQEAQGDQAKQVRGFRVQGLGFRVQG
jgi:coatomer protein complex subunit gamma